MRDPIVPRERYSYVIPEDAKTRSSNEHCIEGRYYRCFGDFECFFCGVERLLDRGRSDLTGKILTVIDGAITDSRQNKAVKDLISKAIWDTFFNATDGPGDTNLNLASRAILANALRHEAEAKQ